MARDSEVSGKKCPLGLCLKSGLARAEKKNGGVITKKAWRGESRVLHLKKLMHFKRSVEVRMQKLAAAAFLMKSFRSWTFMFSS